MKWFIKVYDLKQIATEIAEIPDALVIGAGAGPTKVVGVNCEVNTIMF